MSRKSAFISKILVPRRSDNVIRRQVLLTRLLSGDTQVKTIVAPAGYGKTTLLIDRANDSASAVSWLSLDEWDRDPVRFLHYLRAALAGGAGGPDIRGFSHSPDSLHNKLGEIVLLSGAAGESRLLVLDDFHFVEDSEPVVDLVNYLVQRLPPQITVLITSRRPLPLPAMPKLRLDGRVTEFGSEDLAFGRNEVAEFYTRRGGPEPASAAIDRILEITGGWPAGVALIGDPANVDDIRGSGAVAGYVVAEVLRDLPDDLREFLSRTAVLDLLDPEACDWLLQTNGSAETLARMAESSIPLTCSGRAGIELRIHPLVRDFVRASLKSRDKLLHRALSLRAAERAEGLGQQSEAIAHYLQGEDWSSAARVVAEQAPAFYRLGRWHTIAAWIREFPPERLAEQPRVLWWEARILARLGEIDRALRVINEAVYRAESPIRVAEFETLRASALRVKGDIVGALQAARRAVDLAMANNPPIDVVADARKELGLTLIAEGSAAQAVEEFRAVLALQDRRGNTEEAAFLNGCLGTALGACGRLAESTEHLERARQQWQIVGNTKELSWVLNNLGITYQRIGQPELAADVLKQCIAKARQSGNRRVEVYALISLADLDLASGEAEAARSAYETAYEIAAELSDLRGLTHARCGLALSYGKLRDPDRGLAIARQALASAQERGSAFEEGVALACVGRLLRHRGDLSDSVSHLSEAAALFERTASTVELAQTLLYLSDAALPLRGSRSLVRVSLERFVRLVESIGEGMYTLAPAPDVMAVLQYGASSRIGNGLFREMLKRASQGRADSEPTAAGGKLPEIRLRALGTFEVEVGRRLVLSLEWESEKAREMFLLLATSARTFTRDEIIAALWPDAGGRRAASSFHSTVHRVRRAIFKEAIVEAGGRYGINPEVELTSDVERFRAGIEESMSGGLDDAENASALRKALELYRGPFAPGVEAEWADFARRSLEDEFLRASLHLARLLVKNGDHASAVRAAERILEIDPFNETGCMLLMNAHSDMGDVESALRAYRRFTETLELELGEAPGEDLERLRAELRGRVGQAQRYTP
jgi:ATP/maltotriose-dependent transcriptional regulator MalT/DNA-binding SARP family transcriptional activator